LEYDLAKGGALMNGIVSKAVQSGEDGFLVAPSVFRADQKFVCKQLRTMAERALQSDLKTANPSNSTDLNMRLSQVIDFA
jgi:hypothetical protein